MVRHARRQNIPDTSKCERTIGRLARAPPLLSTHRAPSARELASHAKVFRSETAVGVISDLMRVVGIDSYDRMLPLGGLLADALVLPLFDGGNMGVRRRELHELIGTTTRSQRLATDSCETLHKLLSRALKRRATNRG
jgi:alkylation response protein AidB-like acyl-CoA dehydrogenase